MSARPREESGVAVVTALMVMALILVLAGALLVLTTTETAVGANHRDGLEALYAADAAVALVASQVRSSPDWGGILGGTVTSAFIDGLPGGMRTLPTGETIDLDADRPPAVNGAPRRLYAYGLLPDLLPSARGAPPIYLAVWVGRGPVGEDDVLVLWGRAYGPRAARRNVEVTLRRVVAGGDVASATLERVLWRER